MSFRRAVDACRDLAGAYRVGIEALRNADQPRIVCSHRKSLKGSIDIDEALKPAEPNATRWDYGIGHYDGRAEVAIWVEVHRATADEVARVISKARWLRGWLGLNATELLSLTRHKHGYVWLSAGGVAFQRGSPQARQLAMAGIRFPEKYLSL